MAIRQQLRNTRNRISTTLDTLENFSDAYFAWVLAVSLTLTSELEAFLNDLLPGEPQLHRGQTDTIITVVVIAVVAIVGILIYSQVDDTIDVTGDLATTQTNLTDGFGDAMELVPIVLIVLVAALVIGVISRFRG